VKFTAKLSYTIFFQRLFGSWDRPTILEKFKYATKIFTYMGVHHHILLWLIVIYLIIGVISYFLLHSTSYLEILVWPKDISGILAAVGIGG